MTGGEAGDDFAGAAYQKLGEVPFDLAAELGVSGFVGQKRIQGSLIRGLNGDFAEQVEGRGIFRGAELVDLRVRTRLLLGEVVGRESQNPQSRAFVLLVQTFQRFVLRGVSAERRRIDDQQHLPRVSRQGNGFAVDVLHRVAEDAGQFGGLGCRGVRC